MSLFQFYLYIAESLHVSGPQAHLQESSHSCSHNHLFNVCTALAVCSDNIQSTRPEQYRHWTKGCVNSCVNSPEDGPVGPKHVEIRQYINKIEIVTSVGFYSIRSVMVSVKSFNVAQLALRETACSHHRHRLLEPLYDASQTQHRGLDVLVSHAGALDSRKTVLRPSRAVPICWNCPFLSQLVVDWWSVMNIARDQPILAPLTIFISKTSCFKNTFIECSCYRKLLVLELLENTTHIRALDFININYYKF